MKARVGASLVAALVTASLVLPASQAVAQTVQWTRQFGTSNSDVAQDVAVDSSGNAYAAGYTTGTFPGQTSAGSWDAFVAKYDSAGNQLWVRQFGTSGGDLASGVAVDSSGNAYAAGYTTGTFTGQTLAGSYDAFVAKYDSAGNQLWVRQFGTSGGDRASGVAVDSSGNAYAAGYTTGTFPGQTSAGGYDAFVAKYDSAGNQLWVRQFRTSSSDLAYGVAVDSSGNAYAAGYTDGTFPGQTSAGSSDAFVAKVSSPPPPSGSCMGRAATIDRSTGSSGETIDGTSGDDVVVGTSGDDTIDGNGGNDVICAGPGDDEVNGGTGNDVVRGQGGNDQVFGSEGDDKAYGNDGNDTVDGGPGNDAVGGGRSIDDCTGGERYSGCETIT